MHLNRPLSTLVVVASLWTGTGCDTLSIPAEAANVSIPKLLVVEPLAGQCVWREYTGPSQPKELATTETCPKDIWWPFDGKPRVVALGDDRIWTGPLRSLKWTALPEDDISTLWMVDGQPMIGKITYGNSTVLKTWILKGDLFLPGPSRTLTELDFIGGSVLAKPPEGKLDSAWTSMARAVAAAPSKGSMVSTPSEAQRALVGAREYDDTVGIIKVGSKHLAFKAIMADTPHPTDPLVWCRDETCAQGTPIKGTHPSQLALTPKDGFLLVAEEYSGLAPKVYATGGTAPVLSLPEGARAIWR